MPTVTPATTRPCPPMYLVALCTTASQPSSKGLCQYGNYVRINDKTPSVDEVYLPLSNAKAKLIC
jgi:hypothetical protein